MPGDNEEIEETDGLEVLDEQDPEAPPAEGGEEDPTLARLAELGVELTQDDLALLPRAVLDRMFAAVDAKISEATARADAVARQYETGQARLVAEYTRATNAPLIDPGKEPDPIQDPDGHERWRIQTAINETLTAQRAAFSAEAAKAQLDADYDDLFASDAAIKALVETDVSAARAFVELTDTRGLSVQEAAAVVRTRFAAPLAKLAPPAPEKKVDRAASLMRRSADASAPPRPAKQDIPDPPSFDLPEEKRIPATEAYLKRYGEAGRAKLRAMNEAALRR